MGGAKRLIARVGSYRRRVDSTGQNDWFQNIPKALFVQYYRFLVKIEINGIAHLLNHKALIIAINHKTGVDPIAVQSVLKRRIFFATDGLWFQHWFGRFFYGKLCDGIPVYNGQGVENLPGMRRCLELLHKGFTIGFFPEGTLVRDKTIGEIRDGAAYLSIKSGAPIVPVYIHAPIMGPYPGDVVGSASIYEGIISVFGNLFHKITISIGEPLFPEAVHNQPEPTEAVINKINQKLYDRFLKLANIKN